MRTRPRGRATRRTPSRDRPHNKGRRKRRERSVEDASRPRSTVAAGEGVARVVLPFRLQLVAFGMAARDCHWEAVLAHRLHCRSGYQLTSSTLRRDGTLVIRMLNVRPDRQWLIRLWSRAAHHEMRRVIRGRSRGDPDRTPIPAWWDRTARTYPLSRSRCRFGPRSSRDIEGGAHSRR